MKKRIVLSVVAALFAIALVILPASAYVNHGTSVAWDRGGVNETQPYSNGEYIPNAGSGYLFAGTQPGYYADAYLNSVKVDAAANVNSVTVTVQYSSYSSYCYGVGSYIRFETKLYVNGAYQGVQSYSYLPSGSAQFTFTGLNVHTGDDLDVDIVFKACVPVGGGGFGAQIYATINSVVYTTN